MGSSHSGLGDHSHCLYHWHWLACCSSLLQIISFIYAEKIYIRVIDPFTIKPLDKKTILESARATKGRIITVEDHYHEGEWGLGGHSPQSPQLLT